jgi:hypothetical protein
MPFSIWPLWDLQGEAVFPQAGFHALRTGAEGGQGQGNGGQDPMKFHGGFLLKNRHFALPDAAIRAGLHAVHSRVVFLTSSITA